MYFFATLALCLDGKPGWEINEMRCPAFEQVIDYLDGKLTPAEAGHVAAHLAGDCAACAETRTWYERVREIAAGDESVAPPARDSLSDLVKPSRGSSSTALRVRSSPAFARPKPPTGSCSIALKITRLICRSRLRMKRAAS